MTHKFYRIKDNRTELLPEHASLTKYRAIYCYLYNPRGHGATATVVFPEGRSGDWLLAKFDEPQFDPEDDEDTPAGIWLSYAVEAFQDFEAV